MILKDIKYSLDDVSIMPDIQTSISHREECDPYYDDKYLPLFTAPMSSVVDLSNYSIFSTNGITPIIPRNITLGRRLELMTKGVWISMSLDEFVNYFINNPESVDLVKKNVLIDIANGHMKVLSDSINKAKTIHGSYLTIMAGNVANPETYKILSLNGADYVRVGIGNGFGCLTSTNVGINFPMASLIDECVELKGCFGAKIIADGGFKGYSDIIKGLALGADYVMCGLVFGKMLESASKIMRSDGSFVNDYDKSLKLLEDGEPLYKDFFGMSTKLAQKMMGVKSIRTSEGAHKTIKVEYTMNKWVENFKDYLTSAMSYTNSRNLDEFKRDTQLVKITYNAYNSYNK